MPEGHSVHRIALQLTADVVGHRVRASSPQGRFAAGAELIDGAVATSARAVGKHLLVSFGPRDEPGRDGPSEGGTPDGVRWLRVHLGLYGAWDFHGRLSPIGGDVAAVGSIGAPRTRGEVPAGGAVRMGEEDRSLGHALPGGPGAGGDGASEGNASAVVFPPEPVGQVRLRLMTERTVADLRGPSRCEVITSDDVAVLLAKAGPDPRVTSWPDPVTGRDVDPWPAAEDEFVERLTRRGSPVGQLLMDQSVVSGIGNIYRAEMLFRAGLDPWTRGKDVPADLARALWRDWVQLLDDGVHTGVMLTREELTYAPPLTADLAPGETAPAPDEKARAEAVADRSLRHAVYGRGGEPCYVCGTPITVELMAARKLYRCATCQV